MRLRASTPRTTAQYPEFRVGIRTVELDTAPIGGEDRRFTLMVNGVPVFCKGGDWIPSDSIYARVTDEKYESLIALAREANFNMLRVWGGGLYEREIFYRLCDEAGLLLWHDFMFACSTYPDFEEWFAGEARRELNYQTKRLRSHACLALFCGNNENHWIFNAVDNPKWNIEITREKQYGLAVSNLLCKEVIRQNCPHIPYWNSSPYGGALPNADTVGDTHRWHDAFMNPDVNNRIDPMDFDRIASKFVTEYGYVGPCGMESTREYLDGQPMARGSGAWELHTNVFEKTTVYAGIEKHYLDHPENLSMEDYFLYGGLVQSLMLEYSLEAIRFKDFCSGALFWMYNDTWGEIGWTIVDYYLRKKISFYGVKRALAPVKLSIRRQGDRYVVQGMNDTPSPVTAALEYGYVSFDGRVRKTAVREITLAPRSRAYLFDEPAPEEDYTLGTVIARAPGMDTAALRVYDTRRLRLPEARFGVTEERADGADLLMTFRAEGFVHALHVEGDATDNYFDLYPGDEKTIRVKNAAGKKLRPVCMNP